MPDGLFRVKPEDGRFAYVCKTVLRRFLEHNVAQNGGQIAFFFLLSAFPFLIFFNALIASFQINAAVVKNFLTPIFPESVVTLITTYISYISENQSGSLLSIGLIVMIYSSSKAVRALNRAFNQAYGDRDQQDFFMSIVLSMAFILVLGVVLTVMTLLIAFSTDFMDRIAMELNISFHVINLVSAWRWVTLALIMFVVLLLMYKFMPRRRLRYRDVIPGTIFSMVGFLLLTVGFSSYVRYFMKSSVFYGTLGAVIVLLFWLYLVGIILILGAELNSAMHSAPRRRGK